MGDHVLHLRVCWGVVTMKVVGVVLWMLMVVPFCVVEAMTCQKCVDLIEDAGEFCKRDLKAPYGTYCRFEPKFFGDRDLMVACKQVTQGLKLFGQNVLGVEDSCQVAAGLLGEANRQVRHQACCDDYIGCNDAGGIPCTVPRFPVPFNQPDV